MKDGVDEPRGERARDGADAGAWNVTEGVAAAVRPLLEAEGYDLVLVEYLPTSQILRLYIDLLAAHGAPEGTVNVGIDDCSNVSRLVSDVLDTAGITDKIPGAFNLEVSSPGLDRPLVRPKDFQRFVGREVKLTTRGNVPGAAAGRRRFKGRVQEAGQEPDAGIQIEVDGKTYTVAYELIDQARLIPEL